jgi:hypothetical protein
MTALVMLIVLAGAGVSEVKGQGKVYTNEDVSRPPTLRPAPAATAQPSSESVDSQASSTPAEASQAPTSDYQRALEFQQMLRQNLQDVQEKMVAETNEALKSRWTAMAGCMEVLLQHNQNTINELSREMQMNTAPREGGS